VQDDKIKLWIKRNSIAIIDWCNGTKKEIEISYKMWLVRAETVLV